jgi:hypothetical protein
MALFVPAVLQPSLPPACCMPNHPDLPFQQHFSARSFQQFLSVVFFFSGVFCFGCFVIACLMAFSFVSLRRNIFFLRTVLFMCQAVLVAIFAHVWLLPVKVQLLVMPINNNRNVLY